MTETRNNPLAGSISTVSLIRFAFPSMCMMLFMGLYTVVDTVFVARFVNTDALSSINIVCPVINGIVGLGTMLATGGGAVVARELGAGRPEKARKVFTLIIMTGILTGLVITAVGLLCLDPIVRGLGASNILFPYCREYLKIQLFFCCGNLLQVLYQNLFVTAGSPKLGLILSVFAGFANILFDYIFIVLLQMGIRGAALGTGIGYMIPVIVGTVFFFRGSRPADSSCRRELYFCRPVMDTSVLIESCSNGVSELVSQLSTAVTTFLFNAAMMKLLGEDGVAAITAVIYSQFLLTTLYIGFSMGTAPVISYNYGRGCAGSLRKAVHICFGFIILLSIIIFLFSCFAGESIARAFAGENETVFEITQRGFFLFSFSFLFSGCNIFASAFFTALSNGKASAVISFLRTFGFIVCFLLILPELWNVTGVWLAVPLAEICTLILTAWLIFRHRNDYVDG